MNALNAILMAAILFGVTVFLSQKCNALPILGDLVAHSPDKKYTLRLVEASQGDCTLILFHQDKEVARYPFQGDMSSVVWSPGDKFVAVNNHSGHASFCLWIISLADGGIITNRGIVINPNYDRYNDDKSSGSNILEETMPEIKEIYPDGKNDFINAGQGACVAYGWKDEYHIQTFSHFFFEKLSSKSNRLVQIFATYRVHKRVKLDAKSIVVKFDVVGNGEKIPTLAKSTLGL